MGNNNDRKVKYFFFGVSNDEHVAYSNFVYSLCYYIIKQHCDSSIRDFNRHDMLTVDNIRDSVYNYIVASETLIFLVDQSDGSYNPNVWFELGLASSQKKKNIILISQNEEMPFYLKDAQYVRLNSGFIKAFKGNRDIFDTKTRKIVEDDKKEWHKFWKGKWEEENTEWQKDLNSFKIDFNEKLKTAKNPFRTALDQVEITALGRGDLYRLLEQLGTDKYVIAEFIPTEKKAFEKLTASVKATNSCLRTTRFANRSIVAGSGDNNNVHIKFMNALCSKSEKIETSERIICNNHYSKWRDIYQALLHGGKIKIFIRKNAYSIGFELVIVDDKTTFIHFYQLSVNGNTNTDGTVNERENEVINSTLRLQGEEVSKNMKHIFQRLYQRSEGDPSRTLLGIPLESKKSILTDNEKKHGYFQLDSNIEESRPNEIANEFVEKFKQWYDYIDDINDMINMAVGICIKLIEIGREDSVKVIFHFISARDEQYQKEAEDCVQKGVYNKILNFLDEEIRDGKCNQVNKKVCSSLYSKMVSWMNNL